MLTELQKNLTLIDSFKKNISLQLKLRLGNISSYVLDHLLDSSLSTQLEGIFGCKNYLYFIHLLRNEVIIFWALLDGIEFELSVEHNQTYSSFVKTSALLLYWSKLLAR